MSFYISNYQLLIAINNLQASVNKMSATLSQQLTQLETDLAAKLATLTSEVTAAAAAGVAQQAALAAAIANLQTGNAITPADIANFQAIDDGMTAQNTKLAAVIAADAVPAAPAPTAAVLPTTLG